MSVTLFDAARALSDRTRAASNSDQICGPVEVSEEQRRLIAVGLELDDDDVTALCGGITFMALAEVDLTHLTDDSLRPLLASMFHNGLLIGLIFSELRRQEEQT